MSKKMMTPKEIIKMGMQVEKLTNTMTESIKADVALMNAKTFMTPLTEELTVMFAKLEGNQNSDELKKFKSFVRTKIQPLIKTKKTQQDILGDEVKTHKVTIKRTKTTHLKNDMVNNGKIKDGVGTFRVIFEEKPKPEEKTFFEELENLIDKHISSWDNVLKISLHQSGRTNKRGTVLIKNVKELEV